MGRLILTFNKQIVKDLPFDGESITLGREEDNHVQIDNLAVSGYHARIDKVGKHHVLTDLQSTNGTFVNHNKVVSHRLAHGDNIRIGKHVLIYLASGGDGAERSDQMDVDKTMILDTAKHRELLEKAPREGVPAPQAQKKIGVLSFLDGSAEGEIELTKKLTRIGKSDNVEVRLPGLLMAPTAATISKRPAGYTISFAGGMTKLKVNGRPIKDGVLLKDFDTIELGSHRIQFYYKAPEA